MRLMPERLDEVARAAELHDIGKMAVPDSVLQKPGPLGPFEWSLIRQHTIIGERMLEAAPAMQPVARLVRSTHERWDGRGYPDGLAGEEIPQGARIVAVCDAYDAMTSSRCYRPGVSHAEALAEVRRAAGAQFDPEVVAAFCAEMNDSEAASQPPLRVPTPTRDWIEAGGEDDVAEEARSRRLVTRESIAGSGSEPLSVGRARGHGAAVPFIEDRQL